ncbi:hypothetical protein DPMN_109191 [Dreissena polymorpha]|uniref:Uncharacterized protein n=1 Tax=Dreissena polymorpha TaxID=45954 RepID=A0A9D4KA80_DREPO|nr:hypothetical protein DPMN_109191 [Dreissena polymorpha]
MLGWLPTPAHHYLSRDHSKRYQVRLLFWNVYEVQNSLAFSRAQAWYSALFVFVVSMMLFHTLYDSLIMVIETF